MTPTAAAVFLSGRVSLIALREDAGDCLREIRGLVEMIERAVNRPRPKKYCGNCPSLSEDEQRCATPLYAESHEAVQVTCWRCKATYVIEDLIKGSLDNARGLLYNEKELLEIMAHIGEHIPRGTWWSWRQRGVIVNKNEWGAEPRYLLEDARELYKDKVGKRHAS